MENGSSQTIKTSATITIPLSEYESLKSQNAELKQKVDWLMEQFRLSKKKEFGRSSEKSEYVQLNMFNEAEATADVNIPEPELSEIRKHYRKKAKEAPGRLPEDLPVETIIHELPEDERDCPECGCKMHVMGKDIRRELKLIPAQAIIVEHVRHIYACRDCEKDSYGVPIVKAPIDEPVIKGSFASPEAIAHIMAQKFEMGSPLYRQEQEWGRNGIMLSRQTMSNWLINAAESWLEPVYGIFHEILLQQSVLHADETVIQVLKEPEKPPGSKSYMWLYRTSKHANAHIVLLDYQPDRSAKRPKAFLKGYEGYLHTDGYASYHGMAKEIVIVGCLAHVRRKFIEALDAMKPEDRAGSAALAGKEYCDRLFDIEKELAELTSEERHGQREKMSVPVMNEFAAWLRDVNISAKSVTGGAIRYARDQFKYYSNYLKDGRLEISNNLAERSIKPFVIDRKNFLFANTPRGAKSAAVIFSIIQTARENGLNAYDYLSFIFRNAPNWDIPNNPNAGELILPWFPNAQNKCRKITSPEKHSEKSIAV